MIYSWCLKVGQYMAIAWASIIVDNVIGYVLNQSGIGEELRNKLHGDPVKKALEHALNQAYADFEKQYPEWTSSLFDTDFLKKEANPILSQFLLPGGTPNPSDLAMRWADTLNLRYSEQRTIRIRELEPVAADFLILFNRVLKAEPELKALNDSRCTGYLAHPVCHLTGRRTTDYRRGLERDPQGHGASLEPKGEGETSMPRQRLRRKTLRCGRVFVRQGGGTGGRVRQKRLPMPSRPELSTQMRPPIASLNCLHM